MNRSIVITESDSKKLQVLIDASRLHGRDQSQLDELEEELNRATVVRSGAVPASVVTMNSRIRVTDLNTGSQSVYQIVFPRDADLAKGRISVLAPVGTALLGSSVGDEIEWRVPGGIRRLRIDAVEYQPEMHKLAV